MSVILAHLSQAMREARAAGQGRPLADRPATYSHSAPRPLPATTEGPLPCSPRVATAREFTLNANEAR